MSRSEHSPNAQHKEWWGKRPVRYITKGGHYTKWWKRRLHKIERQQGKQVDDD